MKNLLILVVLILLYACNKPDGPDKAEDIKITWTIACGWCAGTETLILTHTRMEYERVIPCGENKSTINKNQPVTAAEWDRLIDALYFEVFVTLKNNECNVCFDGCDEILTVENGHKTHTIRYSPGKSIAEVNELLCVIGDYAGRFR